MNRNRLAKTLSRNHKIIVLVGALIFLMVFLSACLGQQPTEETGEAPTPGEDVVQTAIAQTAVAESEAQSTLDAGIATALAGMGVEAPQATPIPPASDESSSSSEAPASGMSTEQCELECDTRVAAAATRAIIEFIGDLTAEAVDDEEDGMGGGGPAEEAACRTGIVCAKNISGTNVIVRAGPGEQWLPVSVLEPGDSVPVLCGLRTGLESGWLKVKWSVNANRQGWITAASHLVEVEGIPRPCVDEDVPPTPYPTVASSATPTPATPTAMPQPQEPPLAADPTSIDAGETSILTWKVENVKEAYLYPVGEDWEDFPVEGEGTEEVRPFTTTKYELRVTKNDSTAATSNVTVKVDEGLDDGTWRMQAYENITGTLQSVIPNSGVTARFDPDSIPEGLVTGFGGCNNYNGDYEAYDRTLKIGLLNATNSACTSDIMQQEIGFFSAMHKADRMFISNDELTIRDRNGQIILNFIR